VKGAGLALAVAAVATCAFVQIRLGQPETPDPGSWSLVPVAAHELPPDLKAEVRRPVHPGVLLHRPLQIVPRAVWGIGGGGTVRFSAWLGEGASLHTFFGARGLGNRDEAVGMTLFVSRRASPELYRVRGTQMTRQPCALGTLEAEGGHVEVTIKLRGTKAEVGIRGPRRATYATCTVDSGTNGMVGFRAGQAAVVLSSVQIEDAAGRVLFEYASRGGTADRLVAAALTLMLVLAAWLLEACLAAWLLGRGFRAALVFSAWTSLPLLLLPLLQVADLEPWPTGCGWQRRLLWPCGWAWC